jgi:hypothetical protein
MARRVAPHHHLVKFVHDNARCAKTLVDADNASEISVFGDRRLPPQLHLLILSEGRDCSEV